MASSPPNLAANVSTSTCSTSCTAPHGFFRLGKYDTAVFEAMEAVEVAVRDRSGLPGGQSSLTGCEVVRQAFGIGGPLNTDGLVEAEHKARAAMGLLLISPAHRVVDYKDPTGAAEVVLFADLLLRMLRRI